jgi:hypothetical protein
MSKAKILTSPPKVVSVTTKLGYWRYVISVLVCEGAHKNAPCWDLLKVAFEKDCPGYELTYEAVPVMTTKPTQEANGTA